MEAKNKLNGVVNKLTVMREKGNLVTKQQNLKNWNRIYDYIIYQRSAVRKREKENARSLWSQKRRRKMVFYFKARPEAGDYTIFMGLDKYENEELIKYGFPEDIWYLFKKKKKIPPF